ncbi:TRAUB family protein [Cavenderia fasciculata]|uniref:TRAUB family protein n=1 Tax=Cavenderia fasciculata TaxID=261658 RepID=F4PT41_CACFS|nr:TRAUB family protein [Cavenderia fasciculata]EGG21617.1 TRAUB family protein [Cavenderia fasciculata]|eukprot:XP_004359467.1 TRAUB family protein [Cavenderia fasciculata]
MAPPPTKSNNKKADKKKKVDDEDTKKKKSSLSDDIVKEVTKNGPRSFDPEMVDFGDTTPAHRIYETTPEDEDDYDIVDANKQGVRIRGDMPTTFTTGAYVGKKSTRSETFEDQDIDDDDLMDNSDGYKDFEFIDSAIGNISSNNVDRADDLFALLQQQQNQESDDEDEDGEEGKEGSMKLMNRIDEDEEIEKAIHARNQTNLYDDLLVSRIHLQRGINSVNKFPKPENYKLMLQMNAPLRMETTETINTAKHLLSTLFDLQTELIDRNPKIEKNKSKKRLRDDTPLNQIWEIIDEQNQRLMKNSYETIEHWNNRVNISGDTTKKNLKSINQPILAQINNTLNDFERLQRRTKLKRSTYRIIGEEDQQQQEEKKEEQKPTTATTPDKLDFYDEEIFDDTDFYQILLKQIESSNDNMDYVREAKQIIKKKTKTRPNNNKINKNKAIRYDVYPKLENFMPPVASTLPDWNIEQLYNNLFGMASSSV